MITGSAQSAADTRAEQGICPIWCESTDQDHADGTHYGPTFGIIGTQLLEAGCVGAFVDGQILGAKELRAYARDLVSAANWMEAHR